MLYRVKTENGAPAYKLVYKQNIKYWSDYVMDGQNKETQIVVFEKTPFPKGTVGLFLRKRNVYRNKCVNDDNLIACYELLIGDTRFMVPIYCLEYITDEDIQKALEEDNGES